MTLTPIKHSELIILAAKGHLIEIKDKNGDYIPFDPFIMLDDSMELRLAPCTSIKVPWDIIKPKFKFCVKTSRGNLEFFTHKPTYQALDSDGFWDCHFDDYDFFELDTEYLSIDLGTCPIEKSLQERP